MCRLTAYCGPPIPLENIIVNPKHSLLEQSQHATEAKLAVNGDGFGIAWYDDRKEPGLYRDVLPAWSDGNLTSLCRMVRSRLFLAHVRASTVGETSRQNCHPFKFGRWSFCHNGQVPHFPAIRRRLEAALPDDLYAARQGSTDSEMIFLTMLAHGLDEDPERAIALMLEEIGNGPQPVKITCVFSDGEDVFGFRHASSGQAPTLYMSQGLDFGGHAFASEPLCDTDGRWHAVPQDCVTSLAKTNVFGCAQVA
ncbi:class II glutamine amidotransferase [Octadecabacter sp. B2R22]|nr:class II glutamine amidotransferase [Octadecabacter sp. B2R22]MBU2994158.1 class II glutamine amidotransferase [Octadecabacter sp. B2R22]